MLRTIKSLFGISNQSRNTHSVSERNSPITKFGRYSVRSRRSMKVPSKEKKPKRSLFTTKKEATPPKRQRATPFKLRSSPPETPSPEKTPVQGTSSPKRNFHRANKPFYPRTGQVGPVRNLAVMQERKRESAMIEAQSIESIYSTDTKYDSPEKYQARLKAEEEEKAKRAMSQTSVMTSSSDMGFGDPNRIDFNLKYERTRVHSYYNLAREGPVLLEPTTPRVFDDESPIFAVGKREATIDNPETISVSDVADMVAVIDEDAETDVVDVANVTYVADETHVADESDESDVSNVTNMTDLASISDLTDVDVVNEENDVIIVADCTEVANVTNVTNVTNIEEYSINITLDSESTGSETVQFKLPARPRVVQVMSGSSSFHFDVSLNKTADDSVFFRAPVNPGEHDEGNSRQENIPESDSSDEMSEAGVSVANRVRALEQQSPFPTRRATVDQGDRLWGNDATRKSQRKSKIPLSLRRQSLDMEALMKRQESSTEEAGTSQVHQAVDDLTEETESAPVKFRRKQNSHENEKND